MIYVCLYFLPDILHNQAAMMRQISDLYFNDNWVHKLFKQFKPENV